jgi:diphthine methyl ester acylhydrolase
LKLKVWDVRSRPASPVYVNKRSVYSCRPSPPFGLSQHCDRFDAGVTSIQSHPYVEHLLVVGSYDDNLRLFDVRKPLVPLAQLNVGGGVWRVKWHPLPTRRWDLLVACMYDGFKIVRFALSTSETAQSNGLDSYSAAVIRRFDLHNSIAYGADWSLLEDRGTNDTLIATCSFYDHQLRLWRG